MADLKFKTEAITSRSEDFAQWYTDVCKKAGLMDYSDVKGFIIYKPYGYAIWEQIQKYLDKEFKETGHQAVYMPLVIPESLFNKEKEHVEGFAPETLIATVGGNKNLDDKLIIRPTSEVLFTSFYSRLVNSYRDLPVLYYQWCNVVRWEKTTRPFLRGSEFLWQEGHTIHASEQEARKEALKMLEVYDNLGRDVLAIPFLKGKKTEKEKFAGAEETYSIEALMHDKKALQSGTTHYFGQGFTKAFNVKYLDSDGQIKNPYQTSWGVSTRLIGSIIMVHGDDNGLVLPPYVAPIQVIIVPIKYQDENVRNACNYLIKELKKFNIRVDIDTSDHTPGWKFNEYEMKGVPLRIEVGPRDLKEGKITFVKRLNNEKNTAELNDFALNVPTLLKEIHQEMYDKAKAFLLNSITEVKTYDELKKVVASEGYAKVCWCGDEECENKIKLDTNATSRCMPFEQELFSDTCPVCGKKAKYVVYFAKAY